MKRETKLELALLAPFLLALLYGLIQVGFEKPWYRRVLLERTGPDGNKHRVIAYYDPYTDVLSKYPPLNVPAELRKK